MKKGQTITAVLFLAVLLIGLGSVVRQALLGQSDLRRELGKVRQDPAYATRFPQSAESALNRDLDRDHHFIQLYGGFQRLTGHRVIHDVNQEAQVVKLDNGALNFLRPQAAPLDVTPQAQAVNDLSAQLAQLGIPLLYTAVPQKLQPGHQMLPHGLRSYADEDADRLLDLLRQAGTATLDLRPAFAASGQWSSLFFRTDHHWKPEGAFLAFQTLAQVLKQDYGIATDPRALDESNYDKRVYEDYFLGSQGKRVGTLYAGLDDITMYVPRYPTDFTYRCASAGFKRTGPFETSLLFPERVETRDLFGGNPYTLYSGGDYPLATITNHLNPQGKKVVLLRESFSCALAPFLAQSCSELTTIDLRHFQGNLTQTLADIHPDLVLILYCTSSLNNEALFSFHGNPS